MHDSVTCASHAQDTNNALSDIQNCVDETKQCLKEVEGFSHPCGGPGWRPVVNFDTSVPGAQCLSGWSTLPLAVGLVCVDFSFSLSCSTASIEISEPYNQVCGRVHAYSLGRTGGFSAYYNSGEGVDIGVSELFAAGVIIVRGGDEHVFSFVAGSPTTFIGGLITPANELCPCLSGGAVGPLPNFLNGDYFCETSTLNIGQFAQVSLWDGLNCEPGSQCCDNGAPPYFTKTLPMANTESLDLKICNTGVFGIPPLVHLVELYVK